MTNGRTDRRGFLEAAVAAGISVTAAGCTGSGGGSLNPTEETISGQSQDSGPTTEENPSTTQPPETETPANNSSSMDYERIHELAGNVAAPEAYEPLVLNWPEVPVVLEQRMMPDDLIFNLDGDVTPMGSMTVRGNGVNGQVGFYEEDADTIRNKAIYKTDEKVRKDANEWFLLADELEGGGSALIVGRNLEPKKFANTVWRGDLEDTREPAVTVGRPMAMGNFPSDMPEEARHERYDSIEYRTIGDSEVRLYKDDIEVQVPLTEDGEIEGYDIIV